MPSTKPRAVLVRIAAAIAVVSVLMAYAAFALPTLIDADTEGRVSFAAAVVLVPAICLAAAIGRVAALRLFSDADRPGSALSEPSPTLRLAVAFLQNTLEQAVIAALAYGAAAALWPVERLGAVAMAAVLFAIGRACFGWGQARGAAARAFGFGLTFYPTNLLLLGSVVAVVGG